MTPSCLGVVECGSGPRRVLGGVGTQHDIRTGVHLMRKSWVGVSKKGDGWPRVWVIKAPIVGVWVMRS